MSTRHTLVLQAQEAGLSSQELDVLWAHCFQENAATRLAWPEGRLPDEATEHFKKALKRVASGEPVAYVVGQEAFGPLNLRVTSDVLVPRPDSETLVQAVFTHVPNHPKLTVVDVGTGSGALAAWVAHERPTWEVWATDVSKSALAVAQNNFKALKLDVRTEEMSWLEGWQNNSVDVVISNPPYLANTDPHLPDLSHEPQGALVSGPTGMEAYHVLAEEGLRVVRSGGFLFLEHGHEQQDALVALLRNKGWHLVACLKDGQGLPRCVVAQKQA